MLRPRSALLDCCSSLVHLLPVQLLRALLFRALFLAVLLLLPSVRTLLLLPPA